MSKQQLDSNMEKLKGNLYPGRGIIIGMSPDSKYMVQVYWIMGRSENSRNRIFEEENGFVRTKAFDESKLVDPSLIIYYPVKHFKGRHIVTNGDQTDTIFNALLNGDSFENALNTRCFEPDAPNFTPRISGIINLKDSQYAYQLSILKSGYNKGYSCNRNYFNYEKGTPGIGHCIHTYTGDGNPLPSFCGEPYELELFDDIVRTAEQYWNILNEQNKISLLVKFIDLEDGSFQFRIVNRNK
ncbi:MAG: IMP cyclohydrolase [Clostridiaceae bacterium]